MRLQISAIICTHNPRKGYLLQVLSALKNQSMDIRNWELLIIDNSSTPAINTFIDVNWHPKGKIFVEKELGLTAARLRGIKEAQGNLLIFVDDDNVLSNNYLEEAWKILETKKIIGAFSGQCVPVFEKKPPKNLLPYLNNLVINEFENDRWSNIPIINDTMPYGAGLCVRKEVAEHYLYLHESGKRTTKMDRIGKSLLSGGDNDLASCACDIGMGIGLFANLKLKHLIPKERLQKEYLLNLTECVAYSGVIVHNYRKNAQSLPSLSRKIVNFFKLFLMNKLQRKFFLANKRGEKQGHRYINSP